MNEPKAMSGFFFSAIFSDSISFSFSHQLFLEIKIVFEFFCGFSFFFFKYRVSSALRQRFLSLQCQSENNLNDGDNVIDDDRPQDNDQEYLSVHNVYNDNDKITELNKV